MLLHNKRSHPDGLTSNSSDADKYCGICIHKEEGLFLIVGNIVGTQKPIHVQKKISTCGQQRFFCESSRCRDLQGVANRSANPSYECIHLEAVRFVTENAVESVLGNAALDQLVSEY